MIAFKFMPYLQMIFDSGLHHEIHDRTHIGHLSDKHDFQTTT